MINDIKTALDSTGIKVAGWLITGTVVVIGIAYLYTKFLESRKLRVDYLVSQYELHKKIQESPDFSPVRTGVRDQLKSLKPQI